MVSAPRSPILNARLFTAILVRVGNEAGDAPGVDDEVFDARLISLDLGTGGSDFDKSVFTIDIGDTGQRIVDVQVDSKMNRQVEVYAIDSDGENVPLFWGEFDQQNLEIIKGETVTITASVQKQHFGILAGPEEYNKVEDENQVIDSDIVFNPEIDGIIYGNQRTDPNISVEYLFVDPASSWTSTAETYVGVTPALWTLETAVETLCRLANEAETHIDNPESFEILSTAADLKNFRIRRGTHLSEALDQILEPHGFTWFVDKSINIFGGLVKTIKIIKQGTGTEKNVFFQRPGESLDIAKSNANEITLETNISEMANKVTVYGDYIKKEVTLELKKAWAVAQDALTPDELQKKDESGSQFETYPNVHRKWVFNEAGDYNDLRTETGSAPADLDAFGDAGEEYVHKRRSTERLLTYDSELNHRQQHLEYYDNSLAAWKPVPPEWGYEIGRAHV